MKIETFERGRFSVRFEELPDSRPYRTDASREEFISGPSRGLPVRVHFFLETETRVSILVFVDDNRFLFNKAGDGTFRTVEGVHRDPFRGVSQSCRFFLFDSTQGWDHLVEHTIGLLDAVFPEKDRVTVIIDISWTNSVFRKACDQEEVAVVAELAGAAKSQS